MVRPKDLQGEINKKSPKFCKCGNELKEDLDCIACGRCHCYPDAEGNPRWVSKV